MKSSTRSYKSKFIQVLIAAVVINLANGSNYVWTVYGQYMINEGGWSATLASLPYTLNIVVSAFSPMISGYLNDKFSPRVSVIISGLLYFFGWYLCGSVSNPWAIIFLYGVLLGAAQGMNPNAASSSAGKWAPVKLKGLATGITHSANGLASAYMSPLSTVLLSIGLTTAFHTMGFIAGGLCLVGSIFLLKPTFEDGGANVTSMDSNEDMQSYKGLIKTKAFWFLFAVNAFGLIGGGVVFSQCAMIAQVQAGWEGGYILVVILALANASGRIIYNGISDKIGTYKTYTIMFIMGGVAMLLFFFASSVPMLIISCIIIGSSFGGTNSMLYAAASYEFGTRGLGKAHGSLVIGYLFNGLFGATIAGFSLDTFGSYGFAYIIGLVCMVISICFVTLLRKNHMKNLSAQ